MCAVFVYVLISWPETLQTRVNSSNARQIISYPSTLDTCQLEKLITEPMFVAIKTDIEDLLNRAEPGEFKLQAR